LLLHASLLRARSRLMIAVAHSWRFVHDIFN
jgi:hypothetical protein